jgi:ubiquinone/menaquinone biosynthesis C-methylase UbiE
MPGRDRPLHVTSNPFSLGSLIHPENAIELARRLDLDVLLFKRAGVICPTVFSPSSHARILDLACGPGGWTFEVAHACPEISVMGVDHDRDVLDYARVLARVLGMHERVSFAQRDLSTFAAHTDKTFDFIHAGFLSRGLLPEQWPYLLADCLRLMRPGAMMQCLESTEVSTTSSAFERLKHLIATAEAKSHDSGDVLLDPTIVPIHLKRWMQEAGYQTIAERLMLVNFSMGEEDFLTMLKQWRVHIKLLQPLVVGTETATQEEYEALYDQMILEMMSPDFCGTWSVIEVCGCKY